MREEPRIRPSSQLAAIVVWGVSRSVGLPIGHPGPEAVATADLLTVAFEALATVALFVPVRFLRKVMGNAAVAGLVWVAAVGGSGLAIANVAGGNHGGGHDHDAAAAHDSTGDAPVSAPNTTGVRGTTRRTAEDVAPGESH